MWDEDRDKEMMRNQMFAIILMMLLLWGWFVYFGPSQTPAVQPPQDSAAQGQPLETGESIPDATGSRRPSEFVEGQSDWPSLPPLPVQAEATDDEVLISGGPLVLTFTRIGARLKRVEVLNGDPDAGSMQLVPEMAGIPDTEVVYPLGLRFSEARIGDELDYRRFDYELDRSGRGVTFTLELPGAAIIRKSFHLVGAPHVLDIEVEYENLEAEERSLGLDADPAYILNWGPSMVVRGEGRSFPPQFIWRKELETQIFAPKDLPLSTNGLPEDKRIPGVKWIGYKSKYFFTALRPEAEEALAVGWASGTEESFRYGLQTPKFEVGPGEVHRSAYRMYLGPMHLGTLREAWPTLSDALRFFNPDGWFGKTVNSGMDGFAKLLLRNLNWWYGYIPNYGVAIIMLTVLVRMVMFPLTLKSMRSMKQMQGLAPEMEALREQYKDDQQELSRATMELYKERGINPVAGCFPMFLQMPVFIALYRMLWNAYELRGAEFLWIKDLSQPDRLFHMPFMKGLPIFGEALEYFNILPFLVAGAMVLSMKLAPTSGPSQNPQQKMMMTFMPLFFGVISYVFSSGLNLYVLTSTVLGVAQSRLIRVTDIAGPKVAAVPSGSEDTGPGDGRETKKKKTPSASRKKKKPQHFYDRAQQRKRETAKAGRKKSKKK